MGNSGRPTAIRYIAKQVLDSAKRADGALSQLATYQVNKSAPAVA
jgi:hypothetical protein